MHSPPLSSLFDMHSPPLSSLFDMHSPPLSSLFDMHSPSLSSLFDMHGPSLSSLFDMHSPSLSSLFHQVKAALNPSFDEEDGLSWIAWEDFCVKFPGVTICKRGEAIRWNKEADAADKCLQCEGPLIKGDFEGKSYDGRFFNYDEEGGKVHSECHDEYTQAKADKCLHCTGPVCVVEGKFDGKFFTYDEGKVHSECHDAFTAAGGVKEGDRGGAHHTIDGDGIPRKKADVEEREGEKKMAAGGGGAKGGPKAKGAKKGKEKGKKKKGGE
jgi:hypothetical protein